MSTDEFDVEPIETNSGGMISDDESKGETRIESLIRRFKETPTNVIGKHAKFPGSLSVTELKTIASHLSMSKTASKAYLIKNMSEKLKTQELAELLSAKSTIAKSTFRKDDNTYTVTIYRSAGGNKNCCKMVWHSKCNYTL